jgi:hypothetical protein
MPYPDGADARPVEEQETHVQPELQRHLMTEIVGRIESANG